MTSILNNIGNAANPLDEAYYVCDQVKQINTTVLLSIQSSIKVNKAISCKVFGLDNDTAEKIEKLTYQEVIDLCNTLAPIFKLSKNGITEAPYKEIGKQDLNTKASVIRRLLCNNEEEK